jgi:hypothetical protein
MGGEFGAIDHLIPWQTDHQNTLQFLTSEKKDKVIKPLRNDLVRTKRIYMVNFTGIPIIKTKNLSETHSKDFRTVQTFPSQQYEP